MNMKKLISMVFIATLGGVIALGTNHLINNKRSHPLNTSQLQASEPQKLHSRASQEPLQGNSPDFVLAAEKSLNAVVHIRTTAAQNATISIITHSNSFYTVTVTASLISLRAAVQE